MIKFRIPLCLLVFTITGLLEVTLATPDLYERIDTLAESLLVWQSQPPQATFLESDSLDFKLLFPGAEISLDPSGGIQIKYPSYLDLITSSLLISIDQINPDSSVFRFDVPLELTDRMIVADGLEIPCPDSLNQISELEIALKSRIINLRTIGLPTPLRGGIEHHVDSVGVKLLGRQIRHFRFEWTNWEQTLSFLTQGMQVYAGITGVEQQDSGLAVDYFMLITLPEANGHHFLKIRDQLSTEVTPGLVVRTQITFIAYIRTDNLQDLFAKDQDHNRERLPIKISK